MTIIEKNIILAWEVDEILKEIQKSMSQEELERATISGNLFLVSDISLRLHDEPVNDDYSSSHFNVKGVIYQGPNEKYGKIVVPPKKESTDQTFEHVYCIHEMLNQGTMSIEEIAGRKLFMVDISKPEFNLITKGIYKPHHGSVFYEFQSPVNPEAKAKISVHKDFKKSLDLYMLLTAKEDEIKTRN